MEAGAGSAVLGVESPQIWRHGPFAEERAHFPIMKDLEHGFIYSAVQAVMLGQRHLTANGQISCQSEICFTRIGSFSSSWAFLVLLWAHSETSGRIPILIEDVLPNRPVNWPLFIA